MRIEISTGSPVACSRAGTERRHVLCRQTGFRRRPCVGFATSGRRPISIVGCGLGALGLLSGGRVRRVGGVLEFHGGLVNAFLGLWLGGQVAAMTWGHVILGRSPEMLDQTRAHELVHVRQYERWGPLFGPAYLGCSLVLWIRGRDAYRENPFEVEAYQEAP